MMLTLNPATYHVVHALSCNISHCARSLLQHSLLLTLTLLQHIMMFTLTPGYHTYHDCTNYPVTTFFCFHFFSLITLQSEVWSQLWLIRHSAVGDHEPQ